MGLWAEPPADDAAALATLRALYTDPVQINGTTMTARELLARVRATQRAYSGLRHELVDRVDAPGEARHRLPPARHAHRPALRRRSASWPPPGALCTVRVIDVLALTDGRISAVTMVAA